MGTLRVGVGGPNGLQSSTYGLTANGSDVYIYFRHLGGIEKISIHQSGVRQRSVISGRAAELPSGMSRHIDQWHENDLAITSGWRREYFMGVPRTELRRPPPGLRLKGTRFAPDPGEGYCATLEVFMRLPERAQAITIPGSELRGMGTLDLDDGRSIEVVARRHKLSPQVSREIARYRNAMLRDTQGSPTLSQISNDPGGPGGVIYQCDDNGVRGQLEIALTLPPAEVAGICTLDWSDSGGDRLDVAWSMPLQQARPET